MMPEKLQIQDWIVRATIVVIGGFVIGWALRYFTQDRSRESGAEAYPQAALSTGHLSSRLLIYHAV
ncbi:MAG TPA: hypothetical protein VGR35_04725 [Tepidisphaeraceae bacterium]|nr:hypothetical protein [Tepidisphaeraceae bacterium]